jgi:hypothetical protein
MSTYLDKSERRDLRRKARGAILDALQALGGEAQRDAILAQALARGGFTSRELKAPAPEGAAPQYSRYVENQLGWALSSLKREGLLENPAARTWKLTSAALEAATPSAVELLARKPPVTRVQPLARRAARTLASVTGARATGSLTLRLLSHVRPLELTSRAPGAEQSPTTPPDRPE